MRETRQVESLLTDVAGSVLMEFVVVLPLYLLLLGGLFLVADLAVNKLRKHIGDELVTWVGASRFCPQDNTGQRDSGRVAALLLPLFERSIGGAVIGFKVNSKEETLWQNNFMSCYAGGIIKLPIHMPEWVRGMMAVSDLMSGKSNSEWRNQSEIQIACDTSQTTVFQRQALSGIDMDSDMGDAVSRDRAISACDVVVRGYLDNVVNGEWIHLDESGAGPALTAPQSIPKGRLLGVFAE